MQRRVQYLTLAQNLPRALIRHPAQERPKAVTQQKTRCYSRNLFRGNLQALFYSFSDPYR